MEEFVLALFNPETLKFAILFINLGYCLLIIFELSIHFELLDYFFRFCVQSDLSSALSLDKGEVFVFLFLNFGFQLF